MDIKISGKVISGDRYGRKLGFPTVNLELNKNAEEIPPPGVYRGKAIINRKKYRAGILINPTNKVEAHLLGYRGEAYGKIVTLEIKEFLREYKKFDTEKELINQIKKDLSLC